MLTIKTNSIFGLSNCDRPKSLHRYDLREKTLIDLMLITVAAQPLFPTLQHGTQH